MHYNQGKVILLDNRHTPYFCVTMDEIIIVIVSDENLHLHCIKKFGLRNLCNACGSSVSLNRFIDSEFIVTAGKLIEFVSTNYESSSEEI